EGGERLQVAVGCRGFAYGQVRQLRGQGTQVRQRACELAQRRPETWPRRPILARPIQAAQPRQQGQLVEAAQCGVFYHYRLERMHVVKLDVVQQHGAEGKLAHRQGCKRGQRLRDRHGSASMDGEILQVSQGSQGGERFVVTSPTGDGELPHASETACIVQ